MLAIRNSHENPERESWTRGENTRLSKSRNWATQQWGHHYQCRRWRNIRSRWTEIQREWNLRSRSGLVFIRWNGIRLRWSWWRRWGLCI